MPSTNITSLIDRQKMTFIQYTTILICFLMNMLDGMDVLVISFSAPSISAEWGITPQELGVVFSAALVGMGLGSLFIAPFADRIGRKRLILACALGMGFSVLATAFVQSIPQLMILRFISGLGVGGMLASVATLASEYTPNKSKDFWVGLVLGGYPVGAVMAGLVAAELIPNFGWRGMFQFAGITTLATVPLIVMFLGESLEYLAKRRPDSALEKINGILQKMGVKPLEEIPHIENQTHKVSIASLFSGKRKLFTPLLWGAFFTSYITLYFLLSWIPKLTTAAGMPERLGIYSGTVFNLGAFVGILVLGGLSMRIGLRKSIFMFLLLGAILMMIFGFFTGSAMVLIMFGLIGLTMQGGFVGLYPMAARIYPGEIRTTGVGWAIGAGRLGAVVGPILAGYFVGAGLSMVTNFIIFAIPCIVAGVLALGIRSEELS